MLEITYQEPGVGVSSREWTESCNSTANGQLQDQVIGSKNILPMEVVLFKKMAAQGHVHLLQQLLFGGQVTSVRKHLNKAQCSVCA